MTTFVDGPAQGEVVMSDNIVIRRNDDGSLDEIVAENVMVHLEQMDDGYWWLGIKTAAGETLHVDLQTRRRAHIDANVEYR